MTGCARDMGPAGPTSESLPRQSGSRARLPIRVGPMRALALALLTALAASTASANPDLPRPASLEPNVRFWTRIYTEVDTSGGVIHDNVNLDVVYEVMRFPEGISDRTREKRIDGAKRRYGAILRKLGGGARSGLSKEESRVLALWPEGTSNATFRDAAGRLRFQLGQADKFRAGLARSGQWADHISQTLEEHGVPGELVALPHVESSFNPRAYSRVGAAGLWQFMRSTGRQYLRVDEIVDERMDPHKATVAAARLLRDNYRRLEAWPLAITAYNHGVAGMGRAVRSLGTRDIGVISQRYQSRIFGFASRNFYAEFLAASQIHRNPERYFGPITPEPEVDYEVLVTDHYYRAPTLGRALGVDLDVLRDHNLALRPAVWNGAKHVPKGYELLIPRRELSKPLAVAMAEISAKERFSEQKRDRFHKVQRGETLSAIARRYGVQESELVAVNGLRSRHRISVGQVLRLPTRPEFVPVMVAKAERQEPPASPPPLAVVEATSEAGTADIVPAFYEVRRGDTLSRIASRFGLSERELAQRNDLGNRNRIVVGQRLRVAAAAAQVASAAEAAGSEAAPGGTPPKPDTSPAEPVQPVQPVAEAFASPDAPEPSAAVPTQPEPSEVAEAAPEPVPDEPAVAVGAGDAAIEAGEVPGAEDARLAEAVVAEAPAPGATEASGQRPVPDPSNYAVTADQRITVHADETLGHYAEWLEVSASQLRKINGMRASTPLVIGRQRKLDFSRVTPEVFEERRLRYHRSLQEEFFDAFEVTGTTTHPLARGETLWQLSRQRYEIPMWLLVQYNPDLDFGALSPGATLVIPTLTPRQS
jgi:membrane-bound lytic murein transglycosylase D